jgi:hypothetical protein
MAPHRLRRAAIKDLIEERMFQYHRDPFSRLDLGFMDTTSLAFEGAGGQRLGQHGYSKDHRPDLRQMILAVVLDGEGRPVCSEMWPGNTADVTSLVPVVDRLTRRFAIGRICIVADRGMIVEWSEKRQCWCIEDAEGRCLAHAEHIHGKAPTKDEAVALALDMIRDGRLPRPEVAKAAQEVHRKARAERRAKRNAQPAQQRKFEEKKRRHRELSELWSAEWRAKWQEEQAPALWKAFHEVFDFTDPELWKSNSFAVLRPRLILHLQAIIARLERALADHRARALTRPFVGLHASAERRQRAAEQRKTFEEAAADRVATELARTREVLVAMEAAG